MRSLVPPTTIEFGPYTLGTGQPPLLVAEIGINHNGSVELAKKLVRLAKEAGAHVVKFQKRDLKAIYTENVLSNLSHQEQGFQYILPILQEVELSESQMADVKQYCDSLGITFL